MSSQLMEIQESLDWPSGAPTGYSVEMVCVFVVSGYVVASAPCYSTVFRALTVVSRASSESRIESLNKTGLVAVA